MWSQTLSILIQNVRNQQTEYYLFSNDHLNNIASLRFNFDDDEVLGYYINLLKTISLKLNKATVQFFFRCDVAVDTDGGPRPASFPLYTEAIKFLSHRDGMVRAAVKTLTLNVFGIPLPSLRSFLCTEPASVFFHQLAAYVGEHCFQLDQLLASWEGGAAQVAARIEPCLAEIEDVIAYCSDVLALGVPQLSRLLVLELWSCLVRPILLPPLSNDANGTSQSGANAAHASQPPHRSIGPLCSLYALERVIHAMSDPLLASLLISALLSGPEQQVARELVAALSINTPPDASMTAVLPNSSQLLLQLPCSPENVRQRIVGMLRGEDAQQAAAAARLVATILAHRTVPEETLEAVGLLVRRRKKQRELLSKLTKDSSFDNNPMPTQEDDSVKDIDERSTFERLRRYSPASETRQLTSEAATTTYSIAASTRQGTAHFDEMIAALLHTLSIERFPAMGLHIVGWTLFRLLSSSPSPAADDLKSEWIRRLDDAVMHHNTVVNDIVMKGPWADLVLPLVKHFWTLGRSVLLGPGPGTLHASTRMWIEGVLREELHWQLGGHVAGGNGDDITSANLSIAAKVTVAAVTAMTSVVQIQCLLMTGELPNVVGESLEGILSRMDIKDIAEREIREGAVLPVHTSIHGEEKEGNVIKGGIPCTVSFAKGIESKVMLALRGISAKSSDIDLDDDAIDRATAGVVAAILDPGGGASTGYATVLSVAPLLGAAPSIDEEKPEWLHVRVRPHLSTLLKPVLTAPPGAALVAVDRHVAEGHWVLAFPDNSASNEAKNEMERLESKIRLTYMKLLKETVL